MKRSLIAVAAVFILWEVLDFILHNQILMSTYEETASLWRPMEEMMSKMWIMHMVVLVSAAVFVYIYVRFFAEKNMGSAIKYGIVYGIATGMGMGYGMYTVMPIPYTLAVGWFWVPWWNRPWRELCSVPSPKMRWTEPKRRLDPEIPAL